MKSFFENHVHLQPQAVLTPMILVIGISIACSSYKSAGSQSLPNDTAKSIQAPTPPIDATEQDKPTCVLTMAAAPDIKGLRLGMTPDEVLAFFPGSKDDAEIRSSLSRPPSEYGVSTFVIRPAKYESK